MLFIKNKNFCDINPFFWTISTYKGILITNIKDLFSKEKFAKTKQSKKLTNLVYKYSSTIIKKEKALTLELKKTKL